MCGFLFPPDPSARVCFARSPSYNMPAVGDGEEDGVQTQQPAGPLPLLFQIPAGATVIDLDSSSDGGSPRPPIWALPMAVGVKVDNPPINVHYTSRRTDYFGDDHEVVSMPRGGQVERLRYSTYVKVFQMPSELPPFRFRRHRIVSEMRFYEDAVEWPNGMPELPSEAMVAEFGDEFDDFPLLYSNVTSVLETREFH